MEEHFVAGDDQWTVVGETVLFFGLKEKLLEDGVVQVSCAHHESGEVGAYADRHVSCRHI